MKSSWDFWNFQVWNGSALGLWEKFVSEPTEFINEEEGHYPGPHDNDVTTRAVTCHVRVM